MSEPVADVISMSTDDDDQADQQLELSDPGNFVTSIWQYLLITFKSSE